MFIVRLRKKKNTPIKSFLLGYSENRKIWLYGFRSFGAKRAGFKNDKENKLCCKLLTSKT